MPGYQENPEDRNPNLPPRPDFDAADPSELDRDDGWDRGPGILAGEAEIPELDGNDGLDLPPGIDFGEADPSALENDGGSHWGEIPTDDGFDEVLPGDDDAGEDQRFGDGESGGETLHDGSAFDPDLDGNDGPDLLLRPDFGAADPSDLDGDAGAPHGPGIDFGEADPAELEGNLGTGGLGNEPFGGREPGSDTLFGSGESGGDTLYGGRELGSDTLYGGREPGSETLYGSAGKDGMDGGGGLRSENDHEGEPVPPGDPNQTLGAVDEPVGGLLTLETLLDEGTGGLTDLLDGLGSIGTSGSTGPGQDQLLGESGDQAPTTPTGEHPSPGTLEFADFDHGLDHGDPTTEVEVLA